MTPTEYIEKAYRTNTEQKRIVTSDILHSCFGVVTESGEITDQLKRHMFYGAPLDIINLAEEYGDLLWYIAIFCHWTGYTFEQLMTMNINKLTVRFPDKFDKEKALNRNLNAERKELEK